MGEIDPVVISGSIFRFIFALGAILVWLFVPVCFIHCLSVGPFPPFSRVFHLVWFHPVCFIACVSSRVFHPVRSLPCCSVVAVCFIPCVSPPCVPCLYALLDALVSVNGTASSSQSLKNATASRPQNLNAANASENKNSAEDKNSNTV